MAGIERKMEKQRGRFASWAFYPLCSSASGATQFSDEIRGLLQIRLRMASLLLFLGFLGFLIRNVFFLPDTVQIEEKLNVLHTLATVILGASCAALWTRWKPGMGALRTLELVIFGVPAAFFIWMQYWLGLHHAANHPGQGYTFVAQAAIPWLLLIYTYGLYIPNTWRRTMIVTLLMAIAPVCVVIGVADHESQVLSALQDGGLSSLVLWLAIAAAGAIYGSFRARTLQRAVFHAKQFGAYALREKLGAGGMGEVFLAEHRLLKRPCAVKLIRPEKAGDPGSIARFESEVQATARLTHQNTVEIYDYGHSECGAFYYAMEYLPGLNLQELVERYGPLPPERVVHLMRQVCSALEEAHASGLIHRDIKPGNIFAAERGGIVDVAKLLDFGLVKELAPADGSLKLTMEGAVVGSPLFTAPETIIGDASPDPRSDIYSLGATMYFLLTGRPVFPGDNAVKVIFAHANEAPVPPSQFEFGIPADLEAIVLKTLAKRPEDRFKTVSEIEAAINECECDSEWTQVRARRWWSETAGETKRAEPSSQDELAVTMVVPVSV